MKTLTKIGTLIVLCMVVSSHATDKTFIDYFLPMPVESPLVSDV